MRTFHAIPLLLSIAGMAVCAHADTIGPGNSLVTTFSTTANTRDLLFFYDNTTLGETGSPIITASLYNGNTLLGTFVEPAFTDILSVGYETPTSVLTIVQTTTVDFTSINNATIAGKIVLSVTGGTITFNESDLRVRDALSDSFNSYTPYFDVTNVSYAVVTSSVPEPATALLLGLGLGAMALATRRVRRS